MIDAEENLSTEVRIEYLLSHCKSPVFGVIRFKFNPFICTVLIAYSCLCLIIYRLISDLWSLEAIARAEKFLQSAIMLTSCVYNSFSSRWICVNSEQEIRARGFNGNNGLETVGYNVQSVAICYQVLNCFPRGFGSYFPHIKQLDIRSCELKMISREDLFGLENLELLSITWNFLTSLPSDLLTGMNSLKSVSFRHNKLETMSSKLLEPILKNHPTLIDFRGNVNINSYYARDHPLLTTGTSLKELMDLMDNGCKKPEANLSEVKYFKEDLASGFSNLWTTGEHSDFIIKAGPKEFRVHKTVLAIQSPVFDAMFKSDMQENNTGSVIIKDFSTEAIETFLSCLYTGHIKNQNYAIEVFALAAKYEVPKLKTACRDIVLRDTSVSNAHLVFALGQNYSCPEMQRKSFDTIKKVLPDIEWDEDFIANTERLKALLDAVQLRDKKIKEAEEDYAVADKKFKKT